jgi:hypothetical protein
VLLFCALSHFGTASSAAALQEFPSKGATAHTKAFGLPDCGVVKAPVMQFSQLRDKRLLLNVNRLAIAFDRGNQRQMNSGFSESPPAGCIDSIQPCGKLPPSQSRHDPLGSCSNGAIAIEVFDLKPTSIDTVGLRWCKKAQAREWACPNAR